MWKLSMKWEIKFDFKILEYDEKVGTTGTTYTCKKAYSTLKYYADNIQKTMVAGKVQSNYFSALSFQNGTEFIILEALENITIEF